MINEPDFISALKAEADATREGHDCVCKGKGYFKNEDGTVRDCICHTRKVLRRVLRSAGVPHGYLDMTLKHDWNLKHDSQGNDLAPLAIEQKTRIAAFVEMYVRNFGALSEGETMSIEQRRGVNKRTNSLLFIGDAKSGRTMLASVIAKAVMVRKNSMKFYDWSADLYSVLSDFDSRDEMDDFAFDFAQRDLIVIDGVCPDEVQSKALPRNLDRLARTRMRVGKPTIITASEAALEMKAGEGWKSFLESFYHIYLPSNKIQ